LSDENRIRQIIVEQKRGTIIDRKGFVIAENHPANVEGSGGRLVSSRIYHDPEIFAHLIGYRQLADDTDLKNDNCMDKSQLGDKVGKKGAEKLYECDLRGKPGKKLIEVDARGQFLKTLTVLPPTNGKTVQLAIDYDLQKKAYELIKGKKAAIIALKPQTGEVLVLVSTPSYSIQDFESGKNPAIESYFKNKDKPLFNRALEGVYPPGSVFKPVLAAGALEENKIDEKTLVEDTGTIKAGPATFGNWYFLEYGKTEGQVDVVKAIQRSNDIFFYNIGAKLGVEGIRTWANRFGYGHLTGIGLDEAEGLIPSAFWKKDVLKENWYLGDTYNMAIGQGYIQVTPLQIAQATSVFANDGYLCQPQLLKNPTPVCQKLPLSDKTLTLIKQGMEKACSPGGTGWPLFNFEIRNSKFEIRKIQTACKTGTAESSQDKAGVPHAWFAVYAPAENPEIVLTVLVEESGQGSDIAGPIAKEILKAYFERSQ
jgi:penicillin-binding protein 2